VRLLKKKKKKRKSTKLTRVNILIHAPLPGALVPLGDGLRLELRAVDVAVCVHGLLEGVVLPAEDVVAFLHIISKSCFKLSLSL
jgi:hypothetical protein